MHRNKKKAALIFALNVHFFWYERVNETQHPRSVLMKSECRWQPSLTNERDDRRDFGSSFASDAGAATFGLRTTSPLWHFTNYFLVGREWTEWSWQISDKLWWMVKEGLELKWWNISNTSILLRSWVFFFLESSIIWWVNTLSMCQVH